MAGFLLSAARTAYIDRTMVDRHIASGGVVIADRDIDTTIAYSMPGFSALDSGLSSDTYIDWMMSVYRIYHHAPDLTLYFNISPEKALSRALNDDIPNERIIFSDKDLCYIKAVQRWYEVLIRREGGRFKSIDVNNKSVEEVSNEITSIINDFVLQ